MAAIPYNVVQKIDPRDPAQPKKFYASVHLKKTSSFRDLVDRISGFSTVNPPDVVAVLESLIHIVPDMLANGEIVRLGDLGSFYLSVQSKGFEKEDEVSGDGIVRTNVRFRAGALIKNVIGNTSFRKFNPTID